MPRPTHPRSVVKPVSTCSSARRSRISSTSSESLSRPSYRWRRQALIDTGQRPVVKSFEADPLASACRRIQELEAEVEMIKAASAIFEEGEVDPKGKSRLSERSTTWVIPSQQPVGS